MYRNRQGIMNASSKLVDQPLLWTSLSTTYLKSTVNLTKISTNNWSDSNKCWIVIQCHVFHNFYKNEFEFLTRKLKCVGLSTYWKLVKFSMSNWCLCGFSSGQLVFICIYIQCHYSFELMTHLMTFSFVQEINWCHFPILQFGGVCIIDNKSLITPYRAVDLLKL